MKKLYSTLSVDVVKFEAQDVITASGAVTTQEPGTETQTYSPPPKNGGAQRNITTRDARSQRRPLLIARTSESTAGTGGNPGSCLHYTDAAAAA